MLQRRPRAQARGETMDTAPPGRRTTGARSRRSMVRWLPGSIHVSSLRIEEAVDPMGCPPPAATPTHAVEERRRGDVSRTHNGSQGLGAGSPRAPLPAAVNLLRGSSAPLGSSGRPAVLPVRSVAPSLPSLDVVNVRAPSRLSWVRYVTVWSRPRRQPSPWQPRRGSRAPASGGRGRRNSCRLGRRILDSPPTAPMVAAGASSDRQVSACARPRQGATLRDAPASRGCGLDAGSAHAPDPLLADDAQA